MRDFCKIETVGNFGRELPPLQTQLGGGSGPKWEKKPRPAPAAHRRGLWKSSGAARGLSVPLDVPGRGHREGRGTQGWRMGLQTLLPAACTHTLKGNRLLSTVAALRLHKAHTQPLLPFPRVVLEQWDRQNQTMDAGPGLPPKQLPDLNVKPKRNMA